ncbi:cytochrome c oxidase subunit 3 [Candidatus Riesia pediculicola]|uniref:cytochrome c oxidase subunit 3 n=1 Tax=Candidatus Riesia pediculicola TaxID=401619 RepID=UPI0009E5EB3E|nr:cytochrome c oxidase subunit 3 [Candidatus Riesia pediculicola]
MRMTLGGLMLFDNEDTLRKNNKTLLGFWIYLMSDMLFFVSLILVYSVFLKEDVKFSILRDQINLKIVFLETILLSTNSLMFYFSETSFQSNRKKEFFIKILFFSLIIGVTFFFVETYEISKLFQCQFFPKNSSVFSAFFAVIGVHSLHVFFGLIWIIVMEGKILFKGLDKNSLVSLKCLSDFWHFLDIMWILIVSVVHLLIKVI